MSADLEDEGETPAEGSVLAIGWDVGGWAGARHGFATIHYAGGMASVGVAREAVTLPPCNSFSHWVDWVTGHCGKSSDSTSAQAGTPPAERIVVGIDAPFGFPAAQGDLFQRRPAPLSDTGGFLENPYAFRATDRHIARHFKRPLSASFDKLGNNATVAMHHLAAWGNDVCVLPFEEDNGTRPVVLEVYPAILWHGPRSQPRRDEERPAWFQSLPEAGWPQRDDHVKDALVCAALALAYASPGDQQRPGLQRPTFDVPAGEGWIYYPKGSEWHKPSAS